MHDDLIPDSVSGQPDASAHNAKLKLLNPVPAQLDVSEDDKLQPDSASVDYCCQSNEFNEQRITPDRRKRASIFFSSFRDRRVGNRRHTCSINGDWWIQRRYFFSE